MKIVSWNCHYGFDGKKPEVAREFDADILIIPECREMDMENLGYDGKRRDWYGDHKEATNSSGIINKEKDLGIGVFWKDGITVTRLPKWNNTLSKESNYRYLVPYKVEGNFEQFTLIAVWTKNKSGVGDPLDYVQKAHAAIDYYKSIGLLDNKVVLIGDFNSNVKWDNLYREGWSHTALVEKLEKYGIKNCSSLDEANYPTYCYYHNKNKYHVVDDYCFASEDLFKSAVFSSQKISEWTTENGLMRWNGSDHCPIMVEFNI